MKSTVLIGNNFAVLAAAVELASQGQQVSVLTDGKPLGGHFAGIQLEGLDYDIGMVLIEEYPREKSSEDLSSYDPSVRNDWTRFADYASSWIRSKVELVKAQPPECLVEGIRVADYMISNRLDGLMHAPNLPPIPRSDPRHAINKCKEGLYDTLTYAEAAACNHGIEWHERFIEPFVKKVFGVSSSFFLARFHRAAWVPLYYPETLVSAASAKPTGLAEYPLWTTTNGFVGELVKKLRDSIANLPNVTVINQPIASLSRQDCHWEIATVDGAVYRNSKLVIGLTPERAGGLLGVPVAAPLSAAAVSLLFVRVKAEHIRDPHGCTMIVDKSYAAYRLTDHDAVAGLNPGWHRIVLEASPQTISQMYPGEEVAVVLLKELASLIGIDPSDEKDMSAIHILRCFTAQNSLPIPTVDQVIRASQAASDLAKAAPGAALTGTLLGYGVSSLNDQLIQALKISKEFA